MAYQDDPEFQRLFQEALRNLEGSGAANIVRPSIPSVPQFQAPAPIDFSGLRQNFDVNFSPYGGGGGTTGTNLNYIQKNGGSEGGLLSSLKDMALGALNSKPAQTLFNTLDAPRNALMTMSNNWMDGDLNWGDVPAVGLFQGAKNSFSGNREDKVYLSDFMKSGVDMLNRNNMNPLGLDGSYGQDGKLDWTDIGDLAVDPLTYLTLGAGNAVKATGQAAKNAARAGVDGAALDDMVKTSLARSNNQLVGINLPFMGEQTLVPKFGPLKRTSQQVGDVPAADLSRTFSEMGIPPSVAVQGVGRMFGKDLYSSGFKGLNTQEFDYLMDGLKGQMGQDLTSAMAQGVADPFANVKIPSKLSFNQPNIVDVMDKVKPVVDQVATAPDKNGRKLAEYLAAHAPALGYNLTFNDFKKMNYSQLKDFAKLIEPEVKINQAHKVSEGMGVNLQQVLDGTTPTLKQLADRAHMARVAGVSGRELPKNIINAPKKADPAPTVDIASKLADAGKGYKYYEGLDGISTMGKAVKGNKVFEGLGKALGSRRYVPVSEQLKDHRLSGGIDTVLNSRNKGFAQAVQQIKTLEKTVKASPAFKALTEEELKMVPFLMEAGLAKGATREAIMDAFPKSMSNSLPADDRLDLMYEAVEALKTFRKDMTKLESSVGVQYNMRDNYFPHVMNLPKDTDDQTVLNVLERINPELSTKLKNSPAGFRKDRKAFNSMADLYDAVKTQETVLKSAGASEVDKANAQEFIDMFGNAAFNPVEAFGNRAIRGAREISKAETATALKELGIARPSTGKSTPSGWVNVGDTLPELRGMTVPKPVYEQITYADNVLQNDEQINKILGTAEKVYNVWRRNVTVVRAGFHVRQMIGNVFQNSLAGVTPKHYLDAMKLIHSPSSNASMYDEALKNGVLNVGSTSADMLTSLEAELVGRTATNQSMGKKINDLANPFAENFIGGRIGRKAGEWEDNVARLAHYMWAKSNGSTPQAASASVRKYLFNYSEINKFGRAVRTFVPFYQWMRNNIPFQLVNAAKNPGKYNAIAQMLNTQQGEPDIEQVMADMGITNENDKMAVKQLVEENGGVLPEYIQERYMNTGGDNYFNIGLPSSDLSFFKHPAQESMNALAPFAKVPFELYQNKKVLNGAPIDEYATESAGAGAGLKYAFEQLGGAPAQAITSSATGEFDLLKLLGLAPVQVDPQKQVKNMVWEKRRELEKQKKKQRDAEEGR